MNNLSLSGLILALVGGVLDFYSGASIYQNAMNHATTTIVTGMHGTVMTGPINLTWPLILFSLGILIIVTGIAGATSIGMRRMPVFGGLMIVYGAVMVSIGWLMYSGVAPTMTTGSMFSSSVVSGVAMFAVGVLMAINGTLMLRNEKNPTMKTPTVSENKPDYP